MLERSKDGRAHRMPKPAAKCTTANCCDSLSVELQASKPVMETPKSTSRFRRRPFTSPNPKSSPVLKFKTPSGKRLCNKTLSPRTPGKLSPSNIEKRNNKGETPLHVAVIKGDVAKVQLLLDKKANPNTKDHAGWTPLHEASNHGYLEITKLLVEHGASVNVPGRDNITPVHDAVINHNMEIACYLASKGGDINVKTSLGNSALDLCEIEDAKKSLLQSFNAVAPVNSEESVENSGNNMVLVSSCLSDSQKDKFQQFAALMKAEVFDDFSTEVTHIVTSCDDDGQCTRTLKVLKGILTGKWIVNFQWIELSLENKQQLPEEIFEVPGMKQQRDVFGPVHGRTNAKLQHPPLFDGCSFYLHGPINLPLPPKEEICNLIQLGGGKILNREPRAETVSLEQHLIPYHAAGSSIEDISHYILYQDKPPRQTHVRANHICTATVSWLIACICEFRLRDPDENVQK